MFHFVLVSPEKMLFDDLVHSINAPGIVGYFEILDHHAPLISALKPGRLVVATKDHQKLVWAISGGYFEVSKNEATLLADAAEFSADIDLERAQRAAVKAQKRIDAIRESEAIQTMELEESKESKKALDIDLQRAKKALAKANNRIKIAHEFRTSLSTILTP